MEPSNSNTGRATSLTSSDVARIRNGAPLPRRAFLRRARDRVTLAQSALYARVERTSTTRKVAATIVALIVVGFFSLCIMGAAGQYYLDCEAYRLYTPVEVARALYMHAYNALASVTHAFDAHSNQWLRDNVPGYWAIWNRAGVIVITLICSVLLSVSGMLYQCAFRNPIAGPGMLGVSGGVSLGMMILVVLYGTSAATMVSQRYLFCYGFGAAILIFIIVVGKLISGRGKPFDIMSMILIGSILSQLLGFIVSYVTLFVMEDADYDAFFELSQMLTVDTSAISWISLGVAFAISFIPVYLMRYRLNALALGPLEAKTMGLDAGRLRGVALLCGGIMILAAQVHTGMVGLISLLAPYAARRLFGCEFSVQMVGSVCLSSVFLLVCRCVTDLIPFVGDGLAIGSIVGVVAIPFMIALMTRQTAEGR